MSSGEWLFLYYLMNIGAILKRLEAPPLVGGYSWISTAPKALFLWKVWREVSKKLM